MKIIDQTPYFKDGEIGLLDRGRAMLKFGSLWLEEAEAQKSVMNILGKVLDKNYTLLRNVTPPGLGTTLPLILVGPPGVFVMYAASMTGTYSAKGDQWGTGSGDTFKPEKLNLLTRTDRMARAVQAYLQRQGYTSLPSIEAILLCADPGLYVDSVRPIIRVVMRDALERFAMSITQARVLLSPEMVYEVVNRILNPPKASASEPGEAALTEPGMLSTAAAQDEEPYVPAFALPEENLRETAGSGPAGSDFGEKNAPAESEEAAPALFGLPPQEAAAPTSPTRPRLPRRGGMSRKQWTFLIGMFLIWCVIAAVFAYFVLQDLH
jgi:hypothetical protein